MSRDFAARLAARAGWSASQVALLDDGFTRYWTRSADLARRTADWPPPRRRHVAVVRAPLTIHPYVSLLNTSSWLLYLADVDPARSDPEFVAALLAHGDWVAHTGEVSFAAARGAAWWLERSDRECAAFAAAALRSTRPDGAAWHALADALPWLRRLSHRTLRPPSAATASRPIPGTGLLVPPALDAEPPRLATRWATAARDGLARYQAAWRRGDETAAVALCDWLVRDAPPLLVTGAGGRIVWDPRTPDRVGGLRAELADADAVAVTALHADLAVVARGTRAFLSAVVEPARLPAAPPGGEQRGYAYLHAARHLIAYNLHEPGMDRLHGPPVPFAREMLAARTAHEWAHLADAAGWVPCTLAPDAYEHRLRGLAAALDDAIAGAPAAVRRATAGDLAELRRGGCAGEGLARLAVTRVPDYRANLVARVFLGEAEREVYARHNVRTLRREYTAPALWRMLVRYLFEYQYLLPVLGLVRLADPRAFFFHSTWFTDDFLATGVLDAERFDALAAAVGALCTCHAVDVARLRLPASAPDDREPVSG